MSFLFVLLTLLGCDSEELRPPPVYTPPALVDTGPEDSTAVAPAVRADLKLKRWRQVHQDLQGALSLSPDQVCKETGLYDCAELHGVSMGGISVANGLFEPREDLGVTAGLAIERITLAACWNRLSMDRVSDDPVVFKHLDLDADVPTRDQAEAQVTELTRRFWARDPSNLERQALIVLHNELHVVGGGNAEWGLMLCWALGTSTEALLY